MEKTLTKTLFAVQTEGIKVKKDGKSHYGKYITLDHLVEVLAPICEKHGLLISHYGAHGFWNTKVTDVESGESVTSAFLLPTGVDPQKMGSAITYAKRYNLASIFNIVSDEDNDADSVAGKEVNNDFNLD